MSASEERAFLREAVRLAQEVREAPGGDDEAPGGLEALFAGAEGACADAGAELALAWLAAAGAIAAPPATTVPPGGLPWLDLDGIVPDACAVARVRPSFCAFLDLVPLRLEGERTLVVAVADGADLPGRLGALGLLVDAEVRAVAAERGALARACAACCAGTRARVTLPAGARRGPPDWTAERRLPRLHRAGEREAAGSPGARVPASFARAARVVPLRLVAGPDGAATALVVAHERRAGRVALDDLGVMIDLPVVGVEVSWTVVELALTWLLGARPGPPSRCEPARLDPGERALAIARHHLRRPVPPDAGELALLARLTLGHEMLEALGADVILLWSRDEDGPARARHVAWGRALRGAAPAVERELRRSEDDLRGAVAAPGGAVERVIASGRAVVDAGALELAPALAATGLAPCDGRIVAVADREGAVRGAIQALGLRALPPRAGALLGRVARAYGELLRRARAGEAAARARRARAGRSPDGTQSAAALVGASAGAERARAFLARFAPCREVVAIVGEPGTERARLAHALHAAGPRAGGPIVEVECRGPGRDELAATLLGQPGAAPGLPGALEQARGGTLILRDADELPPRLQDLVVGAVSGGTIRGARGPFDARLVLTLRRSPGELVAAGAMRDDLARELAGRWIGLAPLRERPDDLEALVATLIGGGPGARPPIGGMCLAGARSTIADAGPAPGEPWRLRPWAVERLRRHAWPGNMTELRGVVASLAARRAARDAAASCAVSASFLDADVRAALATIAARAGKGLRVGPGVEGRVSVELVSMPWLTALRLVARAAGATVTVATPGDGGELAIVSGPEVVAALAPDDVVPAFPALDVEPALPADEADEPLLAMRELSDEPLPEPMTGRFTFDSIDDDDPDPEPTRSRLVEVAAPGLLRLVLQARELLDAPRVTLLWRDGRRVRRVAISPGADARRALGEPERRLVKEALAHGRPHRLVDTELGLGVGPGTEVLILPLELPGARHPGVLIAETLRAPYEQPLAIRTRGVPAWSDSRVLAGLADLFATLLADALDDQVVPADDAIGPSYR